jgi:putative PIN family toxin of toxin-antitoxin system
MKICVDTNVLVQMFGRQQPFRPLREALTNGRVELAVSNDILLEYEETITRLSGPARWQQVERLLAAVFQVHASILFIDPRFRFQVIATDPDDNKFVDCAIAAQADFIVTADTDFRALASAGYKPKPVAPEDFIQKYL